MLVKIYNGSHYTNGIVKQYREEGSLDQVEAGAKVKCAQMAKTRGRRVWVDFLEDDGEQPITHRIYEEGFID